MNPNMMILNLKEISTASSLGTVINDEITSPQCTVPYFCDSIRSNKMVLNRNVSRYPPLPLLHCQRMEPLVESLGPILRIDPTATHIVHSPSYGISIHSVVTSVVLPQIDPLLVSLHSVSVYHSIHQYAAYLHWKRGTKTHWICLDARSGTNLHIHGT